MSDSGRQEAVRVVKEALAACAEQVDRALPGLLPEVSPYAGELGAALRWSLQGGKRVRPFVVQQAAETWGLPGEKVVPTACAYELLHTATLIHDDLPCIDDADRRRGQASSHVTFGEAAALLAGDALILAAVEALARQGEVPETPAERVVRVVGEFARGAGAAGVIGGEMADIRGEQKPPERDLLEYIHLHKTAALFVAAARSGAMLAGAPEADLELMTEYMTRLGLLFQVTDDLLDVSGEAEALGKPAGADAAAGKQTYPGLLGVEGARQYAETLAAEALELGGRLPARREVWEGLVRLVLHREA